MGATQKQRGRSNEAKDKKASSRSCEQLDPRSSQGNCAAMPYSVPVALWFWLNPCSYTSLDYSRMYMQSYYIHYPPIYPSYALQRPISDNLVKKDIDCSKEYEKDMKQDLKYLQPRWCPSGLSHTQKRRLQRMRKKECMERKAEVVPAKSATMKQVLRPKQVVSLSA